MPNRIESLLLGAVHVLGEAIDQIIERVQIHGHTRGLHTRQNARQRNLDLRQQVLSFTINKHGLQHRMQTQRDICTFRLAAIHGRTVLIQA